MIIPRKEALQARLEEMGLVWEENETLESLEKRVAKFSIKVGTTAVIPDRAKNVECFGFFYDENADPCEHRKDCKISKECLQYTTIRFEDMILNSGKPRKRNLDFDII